MRCKKCGAPLREGDLYCPRCGTPARRISSGHEDEILFPGEEISAGQERNRSGEENGQGRRKKNKKRAHRDQGGAPFRGMDREQEKLYDERLFRDNFLDQEEEGSHALAVTVTVLVIMAAVVVTLIVLFLLRSSGSYETLHGASSGNETDTIVILSDNGQTGGVTITAADQTADSTMTGRDQAENSTAADTTAGQTADDAAADQAGGSLDADGASSSIVILSDGQAETGTAGTDQAGAGSQQAGAGGQQTGATEQQTETRTLDQGTLLDMTRIESLMAGESDASKYGLYIYDLTRNQAYSAGMDTDPMYTSAVLTVPILYTAAVQLDQGVVTLNDQITYVNSIGGRGEADPEERDGSVYPLSYYLTTMLRYSDNNCINCLIDFFTLDAISQSCQSAGFTSVSLNRKIVDEVTDGTENYCSARDLAMMVKELYNGRFSIISRDFMLQNFRITSDDAFSTVLGLAPSVQTASLFLNQNGRGDTRYAEVALTGDGTHTYVIAAMLMGDAGFTYEQALENVSEEVYQSLCGAD